MSLRGTTCGRSNKINAHNATLGLSSEDLTVAFLGVYHLFTETMHRELTFI